MSTARIVASVLGVVVAATRQWAYFDVVALAGERALRRTAGDRRLALARDAYSYLHLPIVAGIIVLATGLQRALMVAASGRRPQGASLGDVGLVALYGGMVVFLLGSIGFQWRVRRVVKPLLWPRAVTATTVAALVPCVRTLPALWQLGLLCGVALIMVAVEALAGNGRRRELRMAVLSSDP